jgi:hypothetical protein
VEILCEMDLPHEKRYHTNLMDMMCYVLIAGSAGFG